jgi:hypothetical protein
MLCHKSETRFLRDSVPEKNIHEITRNRRHFVRAVWCVFVDQERSQTVIYRGGRD